MKSKNYFNKKFRLINIYNILLIISMILFVIAIVGISFIRLKQGYDVNLKLLIIPGILILIVIALLKGYLTKKVSKEYKIKYINKALKNEYDNFKYNTKGNLNTEILKILNWNPEGNIFSYSRRKVTMNDNISGSYKNSKFNQNALRVVEEQKKKDRFGDGEHIEKKVIFDGIITELELNKAYETIVICTDDIFISYLKNIIKTESNEFNKIFKISAVSEQDAFLFLTPKMMEKIKYLYDEILSDSFFMLIDKDKLYIGQNYASNLFEPNFKEKINEQEVVENFKGTMMYVKQVIDILKLGKEK